MNDRFHMNKSVINPTNMNTLYDFFFHVDLLIIVAINLI